MKVQNTEHKTLNKHAIKNSNTHHHNYPLKILKKIFALYTFTLWLFFQNFHFTIRLRRVVYFMFLAHVTLSTVSFHVYCKKKTDSIIKGAQFQFRRKNMRQSEFEQKRAFQYRRDKHTHFYTFPFERVAFKRLKKVYAHK